MHVLVVNHDLLVGHQDRFQGRQKTTEVWALVNPAEAASTIDLLRAARRILIGLIYLT